MQKIIPNLWYTGTADEAAEFYVQSIPHTTLEENVAYPTEGLADFQLDLAGKTLTNEISIDGFRMILINAGDEFRPNAAINFFLNFDPANDPDAEAHLRETWEKLTEGGQELMELSEYPHSKLYGWVEDKYGVNWQLMLTNPQGATRPFVVPQLMFCGPAQNCTEEATDRYIATIENSSPGNRVSYLDIGQDAPNGAEIVFSDFKLGGQWFSAMDSAVDQPFTFTEGVSLMVNCKDQAEIDKYWNALSAVPESEVCGWLKDQWGVSWQIVPENMGELMARPGAYEKMMQMKKLIIDEF
ncbi:VOC family protein [Corynebacterium sp. S7]